MMELSSYNFPKAIVFGCTTGVGLAGFVLPFVKIPESIYKWTTLALSVIVVANGLYGIWKSRTVIVIQETANESTKKTIDQYASTLTGGYRDNESAIIAEHKYLTELRKKLKSIIEPYQDEPKSIFGEEAELSFEQLYTEINSKVQLTDCLVKQLQENLTNAEEDLSKYDNLVNSNATGTWSNSSSANSSANNSPIKFTPKKVPNHSGTPKKVPFIINV